MVSELLQSKSMDSCHWAEELERKALVPYLRVRLPMLPMLDRRTEMNIAKWGCCHVCDMPLTFQTRCKYMTCLSRWPCKSLWFPVWGVVNNNVSKLVVFSAVQGQRENTWCLFFSSQVESISYKDLSWQCFYVQSLVKIKHKVIALLVVVLWNVVKKPH